MNPKRTQKNTQAYMKNTMQATTCILLLCVLLEKKYGSAFSEVKSSREIKVKRKKELTINAKIKEKKMQSLSYLPF